MNTPVDLAPRPSPQPAVLPDAGVGLAELLEFFAAEEVVRTPSFRVSGAALRGWVRTSARRAARWGAVAGVSR